MTSYSSQHPRASAITVPIWISVYESVEGGGSEGQTVAMRKQTWRSSVVTQSLGGRAYGPNGNLF